MALHGLLMVAGNAPTILPEHCQPANDLLYRLSSTLNVCVPTNLALISTLLGSLSILAWLFAQLPQVYKNFRLHSTSGLSVYFLGEWLLGDLTNLLGCLFTKQATWQIVIACYYCFIDSMLMGQYIWYEWLKHGRPVKRVWWPRSKSSNQDVLDGMSIYSQSTLGDDASSVTSKPIDTPKSNNMLRPGDVRGHFRMPRFSGSPDVNSPTSSLSSTPNRITRITAGTSPAPSPRTVLYITLLLAVATRASPIQQVHTSNEVEQSAIEFAGTILSWISTFMYLGSRLPQLYKNYQRKSTSGLSPALFIAAFFGNLFYSSSMLTNPNVWYDFPPYGGGGWADKDGNNRIGWILRALPFFLGAAGVLIMDACMAMQFLHYGEQVRQPVVVIEERKGRKWRWRRVSGWMRGWMPSASPPGTPRPSSPAVPVEVGVTSERQSLLRSADSGTGAYGAA